MRELWHSGKWTSPWLKLFLFPIVLYYWSLGILWFKTNMNLAVILANNDQHTEIFTCQFFNKKEIDK